MIKTTIKTCWRASQLMLVLLGFVVLVPLASRAQQAESAFDSVYNTIISRVATDPVQILAGSLDSLRQSTDNKEHQARILLFQAVLSVREGQKVDALIEAMQAEELAIEARSPEWQIRTAGFLSRLYREVGLINLSKEHIDLADQANAQLKESPNYDLIQINILGERAHYETHHGNYEEVLELLKLRTLLIEKMGGNSQSDYLVGQYRILGENYLQTGDYSMAEEQFAKGLEILDREELQSIEDIGLYRGMGMVHLRAKNYPEAQTYFQLAESRLELDRDVESQLMVYQSLADYYYEIGEFEEARKYNDLYFKSFRERQQETAAIYDQLIKRSDKVHKRRHIRMGYLLGSLSIITLSSLGLVWRLRLVRKREKARYKDLKRRLKEQAPLATHTSSLSDSESIRIAEPKKSPVMPAETEERIFGQLKDMEKEGFFLEKDVSIATVAAQLETNNRYVSYVINRRKGQNFNAYINELRVRYIIGKLESDPEYLKYKLSFIATEAGFSSHSKLTAVFKEITGMSPSAFISHLKKSGTSPSSQPELD